MKDKRILFITFDLSGYYDSIREELSNQFMYVDYHNTAYLKFKYEHIFQKIYAFFYKIIKKRKLKNYLKLQPIIKATENKTYDYILIVRPDVFFDSQLLKLKSKTENFIAYYHDSINNIPHKKNVIHFFDKVYSYEKKDVNDYNLNFLTNFIYLKDEERKSNETTLDAFTIMSKDYRFETLSNVATFLKRKNINYKFLVQSDKEQSSDIIEFITQRKNNSQVLEYLKQTKIIVDIHKYGVQDGLTFRVFESLFLNKKLITTNKDIKTYDFYNPNNIFVIENIANIDIPDNFFKTSYEAIPENIYKKYHYKNWIKKILGDD